MYSVCNNIKEIKAANPSNVSGRLLAKLCLALQAFVPASFVHMMHLKESNEGVGGQDLFASYYFDGE